MKSDDLTTAVNDKESKNLSAKAGGLVVKGVRNYGDAGLVVLGQDMANNGNAWGYPILTAGYLWGIADEGIKRYKVSRDEAGYSVARSIFNGAVGAFYRSSRNFCMSAAVEIYDGGIPLKVDTAHFREINSGLSVALSAAYDLFRYTSMGFLKKNAETLKNIHSKT